jgi:hypothetical protein
MTNKYYIQEAEQIKPIAGAKTLMDAISIGGAANRNKIVETSEAVYMNTKTGTVGFVSDWDDISEVTEVFYNSDLESWVEA